MSFLLPTQKISTSRGKTSEFGITSSEYGKEIPLGFGSDRPLSSNIMWANNIQREKVVTVEKQGGKGSPKTKTTTTTYLYYVDLAVQVCEGEIDGITRIWGDGKVIFDSGTGDQIDGLDMRVYLGTETQLPDSLIEAATGANMCPGYRGVAYVVFERFPLANFGNRIPALTFEVSFAGSQGATVAVTSNTAGFTNSIFSGDGGGSYTAYAENTFSARWNYETNELVIACDSDDSTSGASVRIATPGGALTGIPSRDSSGVYDATNNLNGLHEPSGAYVTTAKVNVGGEREQLWLRDPDTAADLQYVASVDGERIKDGVVMDVSGNAVLFGTDTTNGDLGVNGYKAVNLNSDALVGELSRPAGYDSIIPKLGRTTANLTGAGVFAEAFGAWTKSTELKIIQAVAPSTGSVVISVIATISVTDIVPGASSWNNNCVMEVNRLTGVIYFQHTIDGQPYVWAWSPNTASVVWKKAVAHVHTGGRAVADENGTLYAGVSASGTAGHSNLVGNNWVWVNSAKQPIRLSLANGAVDPQYDGTTTYSEIVEGADTGAPDSYFHWNDATSTLISIIDDVDSAPAIGIYLHVFSFTNDVDMNPQAAISTLCLRAGLTAADFDVTSVPTAQPGLRSLLLMERTSVADAIGPMLDLLELEVVESDFMLKFFPRGSIGSVQTIPEADMVPTQENDAEPYLRSFIKEEDLPKRYEVDYTDFDLDYQPSSGADERSEVTQFTQTTDGFKYNGTCKADLARQSAQVKLYTAWAERERVRDRLPPKYLRLDAGDVVTLQLDNGDELQGRMRRADIGADFTLEVEQVGETTGVYSSDISGGLSDSHFTFTIPNVGDSLLVFLDSPLIRDAEDGGQTQTVAYWLSNGAAVWNGSVLFRETGTSTIQEIGQQTSGVPYGVLATAPPDMDTETNRFVDESFNVTIASGYDEFESVTDADVLAGRNLLAIRHSDGSLELLQFATVEVVDGTTLTLSRLLRGRRGTDSMASGHAPGDAVYLLDAAWVSAFSLAVSTVSSEQNYRAVTIGQLYEDANLQAFTDTGRDLKPYAPVRVTYASDGASGLDISWIRRTRIGGENDWLQTGDVPLSETSESYEVDVLDGPGGSVLRTLTSATETVNYPSANIVTDFGSLPAQLSVIVYQLSAAVGRGFGRAVTLETS